MEAAIGAAKALRVVTALGGGEREEGREGEREGKNEVILSQSSERGPRKEGGKGGGREGGS